MLRVRQLTPSGEYSNKTLSSTHLKHRCKSLPRLQEFYYWLSCNIYSFHPALPLLWLSPCPHWASLSANNSPDANDSFHLYCSSDITPKDWCIDQAKLTREGMIQQHHLIYSSFNIVGQVSPLGFDRLDPFSHRLQFTLRKEIKRHSALCIESDFSNEPKHNLKSGAFNL